MRRHFSCFIECFIQISEGIVLILNYSFILEKKSDNSIFQDPEWSDIIEAGNNVGMHQQQQCIIDVLKNNWFEKFRQISRKAPMISSQKMGSEY